MEDDSHDKFHVQSVLLWNTYTFFWNAVHSSSESGESPDKAAALQKPVYA